MKILSAMGIKFIRTYNTQLYPHAERSLQAITELKKEDSSFEMYVMLGAWIECDGAWTDNRNHEKGNIESNEAEINKAIELANKHKDVVKIIAVGNEAMVHWAETYFVAPKIVFRLYFTITIFERKRGIKQRYLDYKL
jgi:exo-beta-1,3-glucanase (GH17 family)